MFGLRRLIGLESFSFSLCKWKGSLEKRRLRGNPVVASQFPEGLYKRA